MNSHVKILGLVSLMATNACQAEQMPDPVEFIAGITAFAELCASRYPAMKDEPAKFLQRLNERDRGFVIQIKDSPQFQPALARARIDVLALPDAKVQSECEAIDKSRAP
jgi:hypothetical protein